MRYIITNNLVAISFAAAVLLLYILELRLLALWLWRRIRGKCTKQTLTRPGAIGLHCLSSAAFLCIGYGYL